MSVDQGGYLYAFANDAWGFYGNNRGSVRLTVTRVDAEPSSLDAPASEQPVTSSP